VHLVALVESPDHVCCRYRLRAFHAEFAAAGYDLVLQSWPRSWWDRLRIGAGLGGADGVILQRKLLPLWQLRLLRARVRRRLIFDFDDAVFLRDSYSPKGTHSPSRWRRFAAMIRAADVVIAGNEWLLERATAAGATARQLMIPTCVDPSRYTLARHERTGAGVQLVWVGSSSTLHGIERARPLLETVGNRVAGVRLKLVCDRFLTLTNLPVETCRWAEPTEAEAIAAADIGISWLPDEDWSRGKWGLKVLQYMAAGLPVVANPVGVQTGLVRHGETGFLATTPREWVEAVGRLARDPDARRRMGAAGRRRVEVEYSVAAGGQRWRAVLDRFGPPARVAG
jgi:glycosyltransferase involved in cell wall biosynthesis